jgi:hypothetical protein
VDKAIFAKISGSYFGMEYIDTFLESHPEVVYREGQPDYVPRIYGFRVAESALAIDTEEPAEE